MAHPPLLVVSEIRLGAYNGLQLALRGRSTVPHMTMVLTSGVRDPVIERDVDRVGATFILKPFSAQEFLAAVFRTALRRPNLDGVLDPIRAPFERRLGERRQTITPQVDGERRQSERRRDIAELLRRAASLS